MKKRPLCVMCLTFLIIRSFILVMTCGQSLVKVPTSSVFAEKCEDKTVLIQGQVYRILQTAKVQQIYLKNNSITIQNKIYFDSHMLIYDDSFSDLKIGQTVQLEANLTSFSPPTNPGNFDRQFYYAKQDIYGFGWSNRILKTSTTFQPFMENLRQFREQWKRILCNAIGQEQGGVLSAMLIGEKGDMDSELKEIYQKNGFSHVLAISGLHISFLGLGVYQLFRKLGMSYATAGFLAILILTSYVMMIGISVSVLRAYIMLILRIGADLVGRVYDIATALCIAAAVAVVIQPLYLADAAFLMSHGAIAGILLVPPALKQFFSIKSKWLQTCLTGLSVNLMLFPVLLWFYFEYSTYSILLNVMIVPLMSVVLAAGVFGSMAYVVWEPLGAALLWICKICLNFYEVIGEVGLELPGARIIFGKPMWWAVLVYYLWLLWFVWKRKKLCWGFVVLLLFIKFPDGNLRVTMLDVGQGDSICVQGPTGVNYLVDGGSSDVEQVGKYRIEPFLLSKGIGVLDYAFVSHGDNDHCNGIMELLERQKYGVKIRRLVLPIQYVQDEKLTELATLAKEQGVQVMTMEAKQVIRERDMTITCLQPSKSDEVLESNESSMVLSLELEQFQMLFTGDVEGIGEENLCERLGHSPYDVLKVAHHGSKNSTSEQFLKKVQPKIALISAGRNNSYGHPHKETLMRLEKYECGILQTKQIGAILLKTDGNSLTF